MWVLTDLGSHCTGGDAKVNGEVEIVHQAESKRVRRAANLALASRLGATGSDSGQREVKRTVMRVLQAVDTRRRDRRDRLKAQVEQPRGDEGGQIWP